MQPGLRFCRRLVLFPDYLPTYLPTLVMEGDRDGGVD